MTPSICYVAGKSAGHILPCLTEAKKFRAQHKEGAVLFFSTTTSLDHKILAATDAVTTHVPLPLTTIPYRQPWRIPLFLWQAAVSLCKSIHYLWCNKPDKVVSMGGLVSIPVCLAAKLLRIPIELHELNVVPGKTIKFLAPLATTINICFEQSKSYLPAHKCVHKNYPIRFASSVKKMTQHEAHTQLGFDNNKKTIFVLGGSQGSRFINDIIKTWLQADQTAKKHLQVIHQTGADDTTNWQEFYKQYNVPALVFDYYEHIATLYLAADVIICRAGAGTLFEIAFFDKRCITIPLTTNTTSHQVHNGSAMVRAFPHRFTCIQQHEIEKNNNLLFDLLNQLTVERKPS